MDQLVLKIKVVKCIALKRLNVSPIKKADPYVIVQVEGNVASTGVKEMSLEPIFNESFSFVVSGDFLEKEKGIVTFKVCHHDGGQGKLMGEISLPFAKLVDGINRQGIYASRTLVGQVVFSVTKTTLVNQYVRMKSEALEQKRRLNDKKPKPKMSPSQRVKTPGTPSPKPSPSPYTPPKPLPASPSPAPPVAKPVAKPVAPPVAPPYVKTPQQIVRPSTNSKKRGGGPLSLLKIPIKLGIVAAGALLGFSFVPEDKIGDNEKVRELHDFAIKTREQSKEKAGEWSEWTVDKVQKASSSVGKHAANAGSAVASTTDKGRNLLLNMGGKTYVVARGETLGKVAAKNNTTIERLLKKNRLSDENFIHEGMELKV
mmetsp:Transcript_26829/g.51110  ORF Transcript_26829/g.51110 Transcript_26829/m.51110 type:complete len:371 (+) Transcript_26829:101-1213(+)